MLTSRIIPCLDVDGGRVVKGIQFSNLRDAGSPAERAALYEAQGADELVILDVSATTQKRRTRLDTVRSVRRSVSIPLTVGGGVRTLSDASDLLEAGADKVSVNSAAVIEPELLTRLADRFGCQCTVLAIDAVATAPSRWDVVILSGRERTGIEVTEWARKGSALGAGEILLTSWDRDGTRSGYDLDLLRAVTTTVQVPVIASGGAADPHHMADALRAGADAVLAASIFHDDDMTVRQVKEILAESSVRVRL